MLFALGTRFEDQIDANKEVIIWASFATTLILVGVSVEIALVGWGQPHLQSPPVPAAGAHSPRHPRTLPESALNVSIHISFVLRVLCI